MKSQHSKVKTATARLMLVFAIIVVSLFVAAMILVAGIIKLSTDRIQERNLCHNESLGHRVSAEHLVPSLLSTPQESPKNKEEERLWTPIYKFNEHDVPLIYTEDNATLKQNVYLLKDQLKACGVDALPVDEETFPEIRSNWIDFGEQLARTHKNFLFVVSPLLYKMCHEGKYGDKNRFLSLVKKTKGQHIPLVLLRSFDGLYFKYGWKPRIFLVELKENQTERDETFQRKGANESFRGDALDDTVDTSEETDTMSQIFEQSIEATTHTTTEEEDTLSQNLADDHFMLYDADSFSISINELNAGWSSKSKTVNHLSNCLKVNGYT